VPTVSGGPANCPKQKILEEIKRKVAITVFIRQRYGNKRKFLFLGTKRLSGVEYKAVDFF